MYLYFLPNPQIFNTVTIACSPRNLNESNITMLPQNFLVETTYYTLRLIRGDDRKLGIIFGELH
jgi:hypothetical protein